MLCTPNALESAHDHYSLKIRYLDIKQNRKQVKEVAVNTTRHLGGTEFDSKLPGNYKKRTQWVTAFSFSSGTQFVRSSSEAKFS